MPYIEFICVHVAMGDISACRLIAHPYIIHVHVTLLVLSGKV